MAEATQQRRKLLEDPCRAILLRDYNKAQENRRVRREIEDLEKELAWYNGKSDKYRTENRPGFMQHFREHYTQDRRLAPVYRSINDYPSGQEPRILMFMLMYVHHYEQLKEFQKANPEESVRSSIALTLEYRRQRNEFRLLDYLLSQTTGPVNDCIASIEELTLKDLTQDLEKQTLPVLQTRFLRAIRVNAADEVTQAILTAMENAGADTAYPHAMASAEKRRFDEVLNYASKVEAENPNFANAQYLCMNAYAQKGDIDGFAAAFDKVKDTKMDSLQFISFLQILVCNADYEKLDSDDFEDTIRNMLSAGFNQNTSSPYAGIVSRKFVNIMLEGLPICEELTELKKEKGEDALPEERLNELYRLQMALQLYPVEEVGNLIDIDYMTENGADTCRHRIGRQAVAMLLEKSPDKSIENVLLAFRALETVGMMDSYASTVENNIEGLVSYVKAGINPAKEILQKACEYRESKGEDASRLKDALTALNPSEEA